VTTFKILGVLSLQSAFALTAQHLAGVRSGDRQATASGLFGTLAFLAVSHAGPTGVLSPELPRRRVLSGYVLASVALQAACQIALLRAVSRAAGAAQAAAEAGLRAAGAPVPPRGPEAPFLPNAVNTACFLASGLCTVLTFSVNHAGRPHAAGLLETPRGRRLVAAAGLAWAALATGSVPGLGVWIQTTPLPTDLSARLIGWGLLCALGCAGAEAACRRLWPAPRAAAGGERRLRVARWRARRAATAAEAREVLTLMGETAERSESATGARRRRR